MLDCGWQGKTRDVTRSLLREVDYFENCDSLQRAHHSIKNESSHEKFIRSLSILTRLSYNEISQNSPSPTRATCKLNLHTFRLTVTNIS